METIINILEIAALLAWIAAAIYTICAARRLNKRYDKMLDDMVAELGQGKEGE